MKSKFIKSTLILILGGAITKLLSMVIKIYLTRSISEEGIGLYMMILPTFNLFITLSTLSLSTSISKLISENKNSKKIILSMIPISILYNFILMFILIITAPIISKYLLKNSLVTYPIMAIGFTLPFICLSTILKGYFYGKENMFPFVVSNILEQIVRLLFIIFLIPKLVSFGIKTAITFVVLINVFSELSSSICLLLFMPRKKFVLEDFSFNKEIFKNIMEISLPATGSRLIGSISYFLEPIILTYVLLKLGFNNTYIMKEYGIITGYVFPLLLLPSFFTSAISTSLLPVIANNYSKGRKEYARKKLIQALVISLAIGIFSTIIFMLYPNELLKLIFNTKQGVKYILIVAPLFLFHYIQGPLTSYLQAINKSNTAMMGTLVGAIIKNICLLILPKFIGIWGFISATIINILYVTIHHIYHTYKSF